MIGTASALNNLGADAFALGHFEEAMALGQWSLTIFVELGARRGIAEVLEELAIASSAIAGGLRAATIWGAAEGLKEELGIPIQPSERRRYDEAVAASRQSLGDDGAFDAAWIEGRTMSLDEAVAFALAPLA